MKHIDDSDLEDLIGEIFDAVHNVPAGIIECEGHTTLERIEWEMPYMKESWEHIRNTVMSLPPETITALMAGREKPEMEPLAKSFFLRG